MLPVTWYFKCKRIPDWTNRKFKVQYCVRGDVKKKLYPEPLNSYSPLVQWDTLRLMLIFRCIICLKSQIIDFTNAFAQADIPSGETVFIELNRILKSDRGQCVVVIRLKKSYMVHPKPHASSMKDYQKNVRLWFCGEQGGYLYVHIHGCYLCGICG